MREKISCPVYCPPVLLTGEDVSMKKKLYDLCGIVMGACIGVFAGSSLWRYIDRRTHPGLYALNAAP